MVTYFNLHSPDAERLMADWASPHEYEESHCPISNEHGEGRCRISELSLQVKHNRREELMIWSWVEGLLLHEQLLASFSEQGFTGYRTRDATVRFRDGFLSKEYKELIVTGWAGVAAPESGVGVTKDCPACRWKTYSGISNYEKLVDWTQWTGEDFFIVWPLPRFTLITERVAMFLLDLNVKSFDLRSLDDFNRRVGSSGFTVGRLSSFMPSDLAVKYGAPLGLE